MFTALPSLSRTHRLASRSLDVVIGTFSSAAIALMASSIVNSTFTRITFTFLQFCENYSVRQVPSEAHFIASGE